MAKLSADQLSGLVAGVFLFRAANSLLTLITSVLVLPHGLDAINAPQLATIVVSVAFGVAYLRPRRPRWLYSLTVVLLAIGACFIAGGAVLMYLSFGYGDVSMRMSALTTGISQALIVVAVIVCVELLRSREAVATSAEVLVG